MVIYKQSYFSGVGVALIALLVLCGVEHSNAVLLRATSNGDPDKLVTLEQMLENEASSNALLKDSDLNQYNWGSTSENENVLSQVKAYQRLLRLTPDSKETQTLLGKLLQTQVAMTASIAALEQKLILSKLLGVSSTTKSVYQNALTSRKKILQEYIEIVQGG